MYSGRIAPIFILKSFKRGADGVLVVGRHLGNRPCSCWDKPGKTQIGMDIRIWEKNFALVVEDMTAEIKKLGPLVEEV